jgi:pantetheine-phosphate adenylyltransferase
MKPVIAIYPGSFDPLTNGHLDLIERGSKIFDQLIVSILRHPEKAPLFSLEERREMLESMTTRWKNVSVETFDGLLVDYARSKGAGAVLRGIRAISDYEYELQMALMNRKLDRRLETVFMMPAEKYSYLSSRLVKEIFRHGGSVRGLVPKKVEERLHSKVGRAYRSKPAKAATRRGKGHK